MAWYAEPGRIMLVGEFRSYQKNRYIAKPQCHKGRGKNTTFMHRESWVTGEDKLDGFPPNPSRRTFEEWKKDLVAREIIVI